MPRLFYQAALFATLAVGVLADVLPANLTSADCSVSDCAACCTQLGDICEARTGSRNACFGPGYPTLLTTGEDRELFGRYFFICTKNCVQSITTRRRAALSPTLEYESPALCELPCTGALDRCLADDVCAISLGYRTHVAPYNKTLLSDTGTSASALLFAEADTCLSLCESTTCPFSDAAPDSPCVASSCASVPAWGMDTFVENECCEDIVAYCRNNPLDKACCHAIPLSCAYPTLVAACPDAAPTCPGPGALANPGCQEQCRNDTLECLADDDCGPFVFIRQPGEGVPPNRGPDKAAVWLHSCCFECQLGLEIRSERYFELEEQPHLDHHLLQDMCYPELLDVLGDDMNSFLSLYIHSNAVEAISASLSPDALEALVNCYDGSIVREYNRMDCALPSPSPLFPCECISDWNSASPNVSLSDACRFRITKHCELNPTDLGCCGLSDTYIFEQNQNCTCPDFVESVCLAESGCEMTLDCRPFDPCANYTSEATCNNAPSELVCAWHTYSACMSAVHENCAEQSENATACDELRSCRWAESCAPADLPVSTSTSPPATAESAEDDSSLACTGGLSSSMVFEQQFSVVFAPDNTSLAAAIDTTKVDNFRAELNSSLVANGVSPEDIVCTHIFENVQGQIAAVVALSTASTRDLVDRLVLDGKISFDFGQNSFTAASARGPTESRDLSWLIPVLIGAAVLAVSVLLTFLGAQARKRRRLNRQGNVLQGEEEMALNELHMMKISDLEEEAGRLQRMRDTLLEDARRSVAAVSTNESDTEYLDISPDELAVQDTATSPSTVASSAGGCQFPSQTRELQLAIAMKDMSALERLYAARQMSEPFPWDFALPEVDGHGLPDLQLFDFGDESDWTHSSSPFSSETAAADALFPSLPSPDAAVGAFELSSPLSAAASSGADESSVSAVSSRMQLLHAREAQTGNTPLMLAVLTGFWQGAQFLLEKGAAVDLRNRRGQTAMHLACSRSPTDTSCGDLIKLLLQYHASVLLPDSQGYTALAYASRQGNMLAVQLLLASLTPREISAIPGESVLAAAARQGHADVCYELLQHGVAVVDVDSMGRTSLHWAVRRQAAAALHQLGVCSSTLLSPCSAGSAGRRASMSSYSRAAQRPGSPRLRAISVCTRRAKRGWRNTRPGRAPQWTRTPRSCAGGSARQQAATQPRKDEGSP
eukprot:m.34893 g.34893  ORF g.34893 m.34893 type:complete len:1177 (-) comp5697_c0_seq3:169-3699(-)